MIKQRLGWQPIVMAMMCMLGLTVAAHAATAAGSAWTGEHWDSTIKTSWYTQAWLTNMTATETISDVNVVVFHDSDGDDDNEWEEFTINGATAKGCVSTPGFRFGTLQQYTVRAYDNHHHPVPAENFAVLVKERVYIYNSSTATTFHVDGPEYSLSCPLH